jgi:hypothetical protein
VSLVVLVGAVPQLLGGWRVDRRPPKRIYVAMLLVRMARLETSAKVSGAPRRGW